MLKLWLEEIKLIIINLNNFYFYVTNFSWMWFGKSSVQYRWIVKLEWISVNCKKLFLMLIKKGEIYLHNSGWSSMNADEKSKYIDHVFYVSLNLNVYIFFFFLIFIWLKKCLIRTILFWKINIIKKLNSTRLW
jgi:hypothetical protein